MLSRLRPSPAMIVACLALVVALGGTTYAATTIGSNDIKNNAVLSRHIKDGEVQSADLDANSVGGGKVIPNSLTGGDINESTLADVVHGRGRLLSNRLVSIPNTGPRTLLIVPGLGELVAICGSDHAEVLWDNTTGGNPDVWLTGWDNGPISGLVAPTTFEAEIAGDGSHSDGYSNGGTISLGIGNDNTPRRVATLQAFVYQSEDHKPCGFQAQGTLWTSP